MVVFYHSDEKPMQSRLLPINGNGIHRSWENKHKDNEENAISNEISSGDIGDNFTTSQLNE